MEPELHTLNNDDIISREDLKALLCQIKDFRQDIHVRIRILGQPWQRNFCRVFVVSETGLVLIDPIDSKVEILQSLGNVIEFEIDSRFQHYGSYTRYQVSEID